MLFNDIQYTTTLINTIEYIIRWHKQYIPIQNNTTQNKTTHKNTLYHKMKKKKRLSILVVILYTFVNMMIGKLKKGNS